MKDIGSGNFGVARLMRNKKTRELVAMKYIERGRKIDENVAREIINHRSLRHPNIIRFKEVLLTPTHLAIVMEYAAGGELFERICNAGRFSEDEARFFFQQLISGVSYCHAMKICHRDLKLENTLLDGSPAPRLKICDFGYSKSSVLHSRPKSTVGTPAYIAPEVLSRKEYDGKLADVWSCGVTLYVMLVGAYPFEDQDDPKNFRKTIQRIMSVQYTIPDYVHVSPECKQLLGRIFVANPLKRVTISQIRQHPWFLKNLPRELMEGADAGYMHNDYNNPPQPIDDIVKIIEEAKVPLPTPKTLTPYLWDEDEEEQEGQEGQEEPEEEFFADEDEVEAYEREKGAHERVRGAQERETAHERGDVHVRFQEAEKAHGRAERTHDRAHVQVRGAERAYDRTDANVRVTERAYDRADVQVRGAERADVHVRGAERAHDRADVHVREAERAERTSYYQHK